MHAPPRAGRYRRSPSAARASGSITATGSTDPYEWLRAKDDPAVIAYLEAENAYTEARTAHLAPLRDAIFSEIKARTLETDLTVPSYATHRDGSAFWYYARTVEGSEYAIYCRAPATDQRRPRTSPTRSAASRCCWTATSRRKDMSSSLSVRSASRSTAGCWRTRWI